ncbi:MULTISPECIES: putative lipid II flippase FtsW [Microbacterium]|uniref:putative lipid II flippase FtsW n=1 Tax=Microbacterium TaxID=33882 RepID=UPI000C4A1A8B|nr:MULTISPECIES: putative lipid II flippase FtsW [Microbacterium]MAB19885.1 putative lipid II flippase FtsW [Microbacterium sp.]MAM54766.1 putative lipid II flippase FtsW [Microbacterium sp.]HAS32161.1 putative lipid II flippase FtsW [Microbacterium sp.]HBR88013.1 putative lipid II flippase FtsW [Microbacterium sp.]HBS72904.1 putative lipid II flippase FtsW [Microbacterium sp.]
MTTTHSPSPATSDDGGSRGGLTARVSLGRVFAPVPSEFLLIASTALILTGFGLVMILSATSATSTASGVAPWDAAMKQAVFAVLGIPLMFIASRLPIAFWKRIAWPALIGATVFQLLVFTPLGVENDGNRNWIVIGGIQAQPSEFLKLALALWLGFVLFRKRTLLGLWRHVFIPVVPVAGAVIATVLAGRDLGTAMILVLIVLSALFFSGVKLRIFILPLIIAVGSVAALAVTSPNRMARIMSFLDANCDYFDECYQPMHGIFGLAQGGVFGLGLGNSKEKYNWLPAAANDYIFAIVGEELGLIGCVVVLALFALYAVGAFHVIRKTDDPFVRIVAGSVTVWIVGQALINIGVVLRVFPVLGVPLPFMSQGGTSLLSLLVATGVLLACARSLPTRTPSVGAPPNPGRRARIG